MKTTNILSLTALVAAMSVCTVDALAAETENKWQGGTSGNWSNAENWSLGAVSDTDDAWISTSGATITVDKDITVASLHTSSQNITLKFVTGTTLTISGQLLVTNSNSGHLYIEDGTTTAGSIQINEATLTIGVANSTTGPDVTVRDDDSSDYAVQVIRGSTLIVESGSLTVNGTIYVSNQGTQFTVNGGTVQATTIDIAGAGTHITGGEVTVDTLKVEGSSDIYVEGGTLNVGSLTTESSSEVYVQGGTVVVGTLSQGNNSGIEISGGSVEIKEGTAGANTAWINVSGTGKLILDVAVTGTTGEGGNLTISFAGDAQLVLNESLLAIIAASDDYYGLLQAETITFGGDDVSTYEGDLDDLINPYVDSGKYTLTWQYDQATHMLGAAVVAPEPSMFGLLFGLGAIGLVGIRRRRR